ncbi:hypothetical protein [Sulfurimonas sp. HSL3-2]|uniref:hypothetical protein n=1 Tax=Hydrocurvibacter mobilis TaxID=3131936 RepID=UPI0031FA44D0
MKNILLIAKARALYENSDTVRLCHIQTALNNVTISNPKLSSYIYKIFHAVHKFPEARYTQEQLENEELKKPIKYNNYVKDIFTKLKNKNLDIDIMNISELNTLDNLEFNFLDFSHTLYENIDNEDIKSLCDPDYIYEPEEAIEELGLPEELVDELLEDYVEQILRTYGQFQLHISSLWEQDLLEKTLDYEPLRDLAHKNLGVAKNLRIEDAKTLLSAIQEEDNLERLSQYLELLISCAIKLKPTKACETMFDSIEDLKRFKKLHSNKEKILQTIKN